MKERLATFISGGGTTMAEIIKAVQTGTIPNMEMACIIASTREAGGIQKALDLQIPEQKIIVVDPDDFPGETTKVDREKFGRRLIDVLQEHNATVVTQNGWLPQTPENVVAAYDQRFFNQHPGHPKAFGGKGMYGRRVLAAALRFCRLTKRDFFATVIGQRVDNDYDKGKVVKYECVPILPTDTVEDLQIRALIAEHRVQIGMLQDFSAGTLKEHDLEFLVQPGEEPLLEEAKRMAKFLYPKG